MPGRRFDEVSSGNPDETSFAAVFPELLKVAPPASGKGGRSWQFCCVLLKPCMLPSCPHPTLGNPEACQHCLCFVLSETPPQIVPSEMKTLAVVNNLESYLLLVLTAPSTLSVYLGYDTDFSRYPIGEVSSHLNPIIINSEDSQQQRASLCF